MLFEQLEIKTGNQRQPFDRQPYGEHVGGPNLPGAQAGKQPRASGQHPSNAHPKQASRKVPDDIAHARAACGNPHLDQLEDEGQQKAEAYGPRYGLRKAAPCGIHQNAEQAPRDEKANVAQDIPTGIEQFELEKELCESPVDSLGK